MTVLRITISLHQISLLVALYKEYVNCIIPCFENTEPETSGLFLFPNNAISNARMVDSGIESLEQNSVASSTVSKSKLFDYCS